LLSHSRHCASCWAFRASRFRWVCSVLSMIADWMSAWSSRRAYSGVVTGAGPNWLCARAWKCGGGGSYSDLPRKPLKVSPVGRHHTRLDLGSWSVCNQIDFGVGTGKSNGTDWYAGALGLPVYLRRALWVRRHCRNIESMGKLAGTGLQRTPKHLRFVPALIAYASAIKSRASQNLLSSMGRALMSMNGSHYNQQVVSLLWRYMCLRFASLDPRLKLKRPSCWKNPEAIMCWGMGERNLNGWRIGGLSRLVKPRKKGNLFFVPPSLDPAPTPRLLEGAQILCQTWIGSCPTGKPR